MEKEGPAKQIKSGDHPQFIYNNGKRQVECRCGHAAVWWRTGYICGTIRLTHANIAGKVNPEQVKTNPDVIIKTMHMKNLPVNIQKFMSLVQRRIVSGSEEFEETIGRLEKELEEIPDDYQSETVYAHFFFAGCDWFVLSWDRENEIIFCYVILNGDVRMSESGDVRLPDLVNDGRIELDFYWEKKSLAQAKYDKYPDYFPEPENEE